jgi:hypothetical protein
LSCRLRSRKRLHAGHLSSRTPGRPPATSAGHTSPGISGYGRLLAAIFRLILARDKCGMKRSRRSLCQTHLLICRDFTGATGLEPATSGVTGRARRFRAERQSAGIWDASRACPTLALRGLPAVGGGFRRPPAGSVRDLSLPKLQTRGCPNPGPGRRRGHRPGRCGLDRGPVRATGSGALAPSPRLSALRHEIHVFGEVLRVAANAREQPGLERVHPVQT